MDVLLIDKVMGDKDLKPCQKCVLCVLAYSCPSRVDLGYCVTKGAFDRRFVRPLLYTLQKQIEPSVRGIAEMTGYTPRQVRNILRGLSEQRLVKRQGRDYAFVEGTRLTSIDDGLPSLWMR